VERCGTNMEGFAMRLKLPTEVLEFLYVGGMIVFIAWFVYMVTR
jgi:hypothetical protein